MHGLPRIDFPPITPFALDTGPWTCLQAVCIRALVHSHSVLARRSAYSYKALADKGPCLQAHAVLFASRYIYAQGWSKRSISRFLQVFCPTITAWIARFAAEHLERVEDR